MNNDGFDTEEYSPLQQYYFTPRKIGRIEWCSVHNKAKAYIINNECEQCIEKFDCMKGGGNDERM